MKPTLTVLAAFCVITAQAADLPIAENGHPQAVVVLGPALTLKTPSLKTLLDHIQRMSGARLPVVSAERLGEAAVQEGRIFSTDRKASADTFILLGESALTKELGHSLDGIGVGGIVIKTGANSITLMGHNDDKPGTQGEADANAVHRFLMALGCRHLWPGINGQVIPKQPTITVGPLDVRFTPIIAQRKIRLMPRGPGRGRDFEQGLAWLGLTDADYEAAGSKALGGDSLADWAAFNGLGGDIGIGGGHAGQGLEGGWEKHGNVHPEWFALQKDGSRDQSATGNRWRLCESNTELHAHVATEIIRKLDGKPASPISLSGNDGGYSTFCMCNACKALDPADASKINLMVFHKAGASSRDEISYPSLSDRMLNYWNDIAARVTKLVPDQKFIVDAYSTYSDAPVRERVHPALIIRYVPNTDEDWQGWRAAGATNIFWRPNNLHGGMKHGGITPHARKTAGLISTFAKGGMLATDMQGIYNNWAVQGLECYMAATLIWDPSLTFERVLDDYCRAGFGVAAEHIKNYWLIVDSQIAVRIANRVGQFPDITVETLNALRAELVAAAKAAADDPVVGQRISFLRAGLEFTAISAEAHRLKAAAEAGTKPDPAKVTAIMERRWQLMRAILENHPFAVNVSFVASNDGELNKALGWRGPSALAKSGKLELSPTDNWLNEDQSATR